MLVTLFVLLRVRMSFHVSVCFRIVFVQLHVFAFYTFLNVSIFFSFYILFYFCRIVVATLSALSVGPIFSGLTLTINIIRLYISVIISSLFLLTCMCLFNSLTFCSSTAYSTLPFQFNNWFSNSSWVPFLRLTLTIFSSSTFNLILFSFLFTIIS